MGIYDSGKRIYYLDLIRALAIILVILAHVCRQFTNVFPVGSFQWMSAAWCIDLGLLGVPLFLMISGVLLLNREYTLDNFIKRRFSRILYPFIFWAVLLPVLKIALSGLPWTFGTWVEYFFYHQYWFVWMLIAAYLLLPIFNSFVREYEITGVGYALLIWIACLFLFNEFGGGIATSLDVTHRINWHGFLAGYFGYFILGYYLENKEFKMSDKKLWIIGLIVFLVTTLIQIDHTFAVTHSKNLIYVGYNRVLSTVQVSGLFIFIKYFALYYDTHGKGILSRIHSFFKSGPLSKVIFQVSIASYGIYLTHYFFFYSIKYVSEHIYPIFPRNPIIFLPLVLFTVCFLAWLLTYVLSKIPGLKYISGAH